MEQIDDLNGTGKVFPGEVPDPFGAVADDDFLLRAVPSAVPGFEVDAFAKLFGVLDGAGVSGGIGIAYGVALLVPCGLRENASEFDFLCVGALLSCLAVPRSLCSLSVFPCHPFRYIGIGIGSPTITSRSRK